MRCLAWIQAISGQARALLQEQALLCLWKKPRREGSAGARTRGQAPPCMLKVKQLAETLKQELNSTMTQVVDTVVKVFAKPPRPYTQAFPHFPYLLKDFLLLSMETIPISTPNQEAGARR
ncbi:prospero homeobox protein 1-like protein [Lates japonicus]|uniref:Prospero homeobox protein 1-like protein n=1 Tax=Lates japonicus TaxID=270547 RepID=A0AAD3R0Y3_LATJO|nr:prospero homeobox protein 1-like protein [Lates japonicus]